MEGNTVKSPFCKDLYPMSRQQIVNNVRREPYLMKMNDFLTKPKDLLTIDPVDFTNYLLLQTYYYIKQKMKA